RRPATSPGTPARSSGRRPVSRRPARRRSTPSGNPLRWPCRATRPRLDVSPEDRSQARPALVRRTSGQSGPQSFLSTLCAFGRRILVLMATTSAITGTKRSDWFVTRLFGTDGVRGLAGRDLTAGLALELAIAAAQVLPERGSTDRRPLAVVGRDP